MDTHGLLESFPLGELYSVAGLHINIQHSAFEIGVFFAWRKRVNEKEALGGEEWVGETEMD